VAAGIAVVHQGVEVHIGQHIHMPAAPTITTIGAAELFVLLVPKRDAAITPVASGYVDKGFVNKFHKGSVSWSADAELGNAKNAKNKKLAKKPFYFFAIFAPFRAFCDT
jgi:hypothetical protein